MDLRLYNNKLLIVLFVFFMPSMVLAQVCGKKTVLHIVTADQSCADATTCDATYPASLPTNCTGTLDTASSGMCVCQYNVCCNDGVASYEDGVVSYINQSVGAGEDVAATARSIYDANISSLTLPAAQTGYTLTGSLSAMVYSESLGVDGTGILNWSGYKRGYYSLSTSPAGTLSATPVLSGGTGGGGGGVSALDIQTSTETALNNFFASPNGVTLSDISAVESPPVVSGVDLYWPSQDISSNFDTFLNNVRSSGLFNLPSNLTLGLPVSGSSSLVSFSAGVYGNHSYDFSAGSWPSIMLIIKSLVLLAFSFASIRIVVLKK